MLPKVVKIEPTINLRTHESINTVKKRRVCAYARVSTSSNEQKQAMRRRSIIIENISCLIPTGNMSEFTLMKVLPVQAPSAEADSTI